MEVRARFEWARRRGRPAWLWPDVQPEAWREALRAIEGATRQVLSAEADTTRLEGDPSTLGIAAYTSGMGPVLGRWIEEGVVEAPDPISELLLLHLRHGRERVARLTAETTRAVGVLARAGVVPTVLKGMHTAHEYLEEPGVRPMSDVDLLVRPEGVGAAGAALREAGYAQVATQHRPYKSEWAPAGSTSLPRSLSLAHADDPIRLELHASLDRNFFGAATVRLDRVADVGSRSWSPGPAARVLGQPLLALLLATHASEGLHSLTLIRLVELVTVLRRDAAAGVLRWEELVEGARLAGGLRYAYPALELCEQLAQGTVPERVLAEFEAAATPALRRVIDRVTPGTAQRIDELSLEERLMWSGSGWQHIRRLAHALWPAPAGRSLAELGRIYRKRALRLFRGTVTR